MEDATGLDWADYVALYGAMVATAVAIYNAVSEYRQRRPSIKVRTWIGVHEYPSGDLSEEAVFLTASNPGEKTVVLSSMGVILPSGNRMWLGEGTRRSEVSFPYELSSEDSCSVWVYCQEVAWVVKQEGLGGEVGLVGFYNDKIGRTYMSKPTKFDVDFYV